MPKWLPAGAVFLTAILCTTSSVLAQTGRVGGTVKAESGDPIKGATVVVENPLSAPSTFTATTDDKGRYSIIGVKTGVWTFTAVAPGYAPSQTIARLQTLNPNTAMDFKLAKGAAGPLAGVLAGVDTKKLQDDLAAAADLFDAENYNQAIVAYQALLTRVPALTLINLQIAHAYHLKKDYAKAAAAYQEVLKADPENEKAKASLGELPQ